MSLYLSFRLSLPLLTLLYTLLEDLSLEIITSGIFLISLLLIWTFIFWIKTILIELAYLSKQHFSIFLKLLSQNWEFTYLFLDLFSFVAVLLADDIIYEGSYDW